MYYPFPGNITAIAYQVLYLTLSWLMMFYPSSFLGTCIWRVCGHRVMLGQ